MVINFPEADKHFQSQYLSLEKGKGYELVLSNWRVEDRKKFDQPEGGEDTEKVLSFDVLKVDGEEFPQGEKVWQSKSSRLYDAIKPVLLLAQTKPVQAVLVHVTLSKDNHYTVIDLNKARGVN